MNLKVLYLNIFISLTKLVTSFNLDVTSRTVLPNPEGNRGGRESYFGYTVALHSSGNTAWAFIGAPRANGSTSSDVTEEGALYRCQVGEGVCQRLTVADRGYQGPESETYIELKEFNWLGGSLDVSRGDSDPLIVTCSPRWRYQLTYDSRYFMNGACFWAKLSDLTSPGPTPDTWIPVFSLVDFDKQVMQDQSGTYYNYQYGQLGISAHLLTGDAGLLMGAPGVHQWKGTVATLMTKDSNWVIESRFELEGSRRDILEQDVKEPLSQSRDYDYYGYTVTSGRFWGQQDSYVSSAPRADLHGKVYVVGSESRRVEWLTTGPQLGSGFGLALAAGDVTGDGRDELFVGAPLIEKSDVWEAGAVFVYTPGSSGEMALSARLERWVGASGEGGGGRFGSAVTIIGDLDRDGFNDLAVGAPYLDVGGVVYIYRGSASGLTLTASQVISAQDITNGLRGFGSAISKGVDVDGNGYIDIGVGAHEGQGAAVVIKARKVLTLDMTLEPDLEVVTEAGTAFSVEACGKYRGHSLQDQLGLVYKGTIDRDHSSPRAVFLKSWSSQVRSEVTGRRGERVCLTYQVKLKESIADFQTPLQITFQCEPKVEDSGTIQAPESNPATSVQIPLALGCGKDGMCSPHLALSVQWSDGFDGTYTLGSRVTLKLRVKVKVSEEPAYMGRVRIVPPAGFAPSYPPYSCDVIAGSELNCKLTNPLQDSQEELEVALVEMGGGGAREGEAEVEVVVEAKGADSVPSHKTVRIVKDVSLVVRGYTNAEYFYYNPNVSEPVASTRVTLQAENSGVSRAKETVLVAHLPASFSTSQGGVEKFGEVEIASGSETVNCIFDSISGGSDNLGRVSGPQGSPTPPAEAAQSVWCGREGVNCERVRCHLGELSQATTVGLVFTYNMTPIVERYGRNVTLGSHLSAVLTSPDATEARTGVWSLIVPQGYVPPHPPAPPVPLWVWVLGVLVGVGVLAGMVAGLWKLGFFKRRKPGMQEGEDVERSREGEKEEDQEQGDTEEGEEEEEGLLEEVGDKEDEKEEEEENEK